MNIRYSLLVSAVLLSACGSETKVEVASKSATPVKTTTMDLSTSQEQPMVASMVTDAGSAPDSDDSGSSSEVTERQNQQAEPLLPLGRLIGVVDSNDYRQATIDNQGKVIRLREGDDWQGWTVASIGQKKIVISKDNVEHSLLLLSEFRAPESAKGQLALQQVAQSLSGDPAAPQFTQEQLSKLRSNLLMGRSVAE